MTEIPIVPDDNLPSSTPYGLALPPPWKLDVALTMPDWLSLAFFPFTLIPVEPEDFELGWRGVVPCWATLAEALFSEWLRRRELNLVADFEKRRAGWERYLRGVFERATELGDGGG